MKDENFNSGPVDDVHKQNGSVGLDALKQRAMSERSGFIEGAEETNFRFSALLRAYTGATSDVGTVVKRAKLFRASLDEFLPFVDRLIEAGKELPNE